MYTGTPNTHTFALAEWHIQTLEKDKEQCIPHINL